jgi:hypothetical protein
VVGTDDSGDIPHTLLDGLGTAAHPVRVRAVDRGSDEGGRGERVVARVAELRGRGGATAGHVLEVGACLDVTDAVRCTVAHRTGRRTMAI